MVVTFVKMSKYIETVVCVATFSHKADYYASLQVICYIFHTAKFQFVKRTADCAES